MAQRISQSWPEIPDRRGGHFLAPTEAEFLQVIGSSANAMLGWKFLPFARYVAGWAGDIYRTKTFGRDDVHRIPLHPYPRATESYVALVIYYQAGEIYEAGSDSVAAANGHSISADLYTYAGVSLDGNGAPYACVWSVADGTLETRVEGQRFVRLQAQADPVITAEYPVLTATTGMGIITSPTNPTRPRPLIIPDTNGGAELLVRLTTVNVRILAVDAWQMWQETLDE